jgi:Domain of Unknown Function with PDB structure (DUF3857)/Transglutaminase-like superfamily
LALLVRRLLLLSLAFLPCTAFAGDWPQPTPDELKMTSDPAAPDAPAVYLFREETVVDDLHMHSMSARVKILTEKGKEMFSDIEIPYEGRNFSITDVGARTIHSDGTVIPFTGKPIEKLIVRTSQYKYMQKVLSLPDVQVGSIIEYHWKLRYDDNSFSSPYWYIQQPVFVHQAHYHFRPTASSNTILHTDAWGHQMPSVGLFYTKALPPGADLKYQVDGYDLLIQNVPPLPDEDFMPPFRSFSYRVMFYYSPWRSTDDFWKNQGKYWSKDVDRFAEPNGKIHEAVQQIVAADDTDDQKLQKIYAAVMKVENTGFTREHSAAENKAEGLKIKNAADIWTQQRGTDDEITRLFIALCRAAGFKAYGMVVVDRDQSVLQQAYLDWDQLNDELAIVAVGGKEVFFDPGERYCEFGKLHWRHTWVSGLRQTDNGVDFAKTPGLNYQDSITYRNAILTLDSNGELKGVIRIAMNGNDALRWRQAALRSDQDEVKKDFEQYLQRSVPSGVLVKTNHFVALSDPGTNLMVVLDVSGSLGTVTGKRVFLPATFFEASSKPLFAGSKRENPVDLHYPYSVRDDFRLTLPAGMAMESLPDKANIAFAQNGDYSAKYEMDEGAYHYVRLVRMAAAFYKTEEYPNLRGFFQKMNSQDQSQLILKQGTTATSQATPAGKGQ